MSDYSNSCRKSMSPQGDLHDATFKLSECQQSTLKQRAPSTSRNNTSRRYQNDDSVDKLLSQFTEIKVDK